MSRFYTGNPLGSDDPRDLDDNAKNMDLAVNSDGDTFQDRLGRSRLTWAGVVKSGTGDPGEIAAIVDEALGEGVAAAQVQAERAQVQAERAQGQAERAQQQADRAESAAGSASINANVYPDEAAGRAAVEIGQQFQVATSDGLEITRYRKDTAGSSTPVARYPGSALVSLSMSDALIDGMDFERSANLLDPFQSVENAIIGTDGTVNSSDTSAYSGWIKVIPGKSYTIQGLHSIAQYDFGKSFLRRVAATTDGAFLVPDDTQYIRINYAYTVTQSRGFFDGAPTNEAAEIIIPRLNLEGRVRPEDTTFLEPSINLYDPSGDVPGLIDPVTGEVVLGSQPDYITTGFIKVEPGEVYSQLLGPLEGVYGGFLVIGNYTANKTFVRRFGSVSTPFETYEIPPTIEYIRLTYRGSPEGRMLVRGSYMPSEFVPYGATLTGVRVEGGGGGGPVGPIGTHDIIDGAVTPEKTSFIGPSLNLFDPDDVEDFLIIGQDGTPTASESYKTTGFIPVEASTDYTWYGSDPALSPFIYIAQYNSRRQFISRLGLTTVNKQTTRFDTAFVRLMFPRAVDMDRMFAKGSVPPARFVPFTKTLQGVVLSPEAVHDIKVGQDRPMLDITGDLFFGTDDDFADIAGFNTLTSSDVYAMWDALMADHPEYISKTALGDDDFGNPLALYTLAPPRPVAPFNDLRRPKIFLVSGIHGGEDVSGFGSYALANRMCGAWAASDALEMLRFNVELLVIPVANPSGWNARTRKNGNGVDLNRNFPEGWVESDPSDVTYGGPSPLSELEAQYISQVMQENPDIDMFCDFHNFGAGGGTGGSGNSFVWVSSVPGRYVPHLAQIMMQRLTRKWRTEYDWIPDDPAWFAGYASVSTGGMAKMHAFEAHGVELSATFEVSNVWSLQPGTPLYSPEQKRSTIEALVNWLVLNVKEVVRRG